MYAETMSDIKPFIRTENISRVFKTGGNKIPAHGTSYL